VKIANDFDRITIRFCKSSTNFRPGRHYPPPAESNLFGKNGELVGYGGGMWRKQFLLNLEKKSN